MAISVTRFGGHDGKRVDQFSLLSTSGVEVDIISYGVAVRDWRVPVAGAMRPVVLGLKTLDAYVAHSPHLGALTGRVANRIGGAGFSIAGRLYRLPANEGTSTLHGGPEGLGRVVWEAEPDTARNAVRFRYFSPDGEMGFPGNVEFIATYTLSGNRLRLDIEATTDEVTPISLVQHHYWNLGTGPDVIEHRYRIDAGAYTPLDGALLPTGAILDVAGTKWDFRAAKTMRDAAGAPMSFDGNLVLDAGRDLAKPVAEVVGPDGALTLRLWSDRPGLQLYNSIYLDLSVPGLNGRRYGQFAGFCLEDQSFPGAVHHAHFPSIWHAPERPYGHWCEIEIG